MIHIHKAFPRPPKADARERALANVFLAAIRAAADRTNVGDLVQALNSGEPDKAVSMIRWDVVQDELGAALPKRYGTIYRAGAEQARKQLRQALRKDTIGYGFDYTSPDAVRWADARAGMLISEWGRMSREALRALIVRAFEDGIPPRKLARLIIQSGLGLTERQALAVERRRAQLLADGIVEGQADRLVDKYSAQLLRQRAETIARTEIITAHTQGAQAAWTDAIDEGLLDRDTSRQVWITDADERTCEVCAALDDVEAKLGEVFVDDPDLGPIYGPPAHPNCRCSVAMRPEAVSDRP